jgi:broad specificity phosphatase PhoE
MMKQRVLYLIRHGRSEGNENHKAYLTKHDYQIDLTEEGVEQAKRMGNEFSQFKDRDWAVSTIFCSPYLRCRETLNYGFGPNFPCDVQIDYRLREQYLGTPEDPEALVELWRCHDANPFYCDAHGSEFPISVFDRVHSFLDNIHRFGCIHHIIITHGHVIRAMETILTGRSMDEHARTGYRRNCDVLKMSVRI